MDINALLMASPIDESDIVLGLKEVQKHLDTLIDLVSQHSPGSSNELEREPDSISLIDPFNRSNVQRSVPKEHIVQVNDLLDKFEDSLVRIINYKGIDREFVVNQYVNLLENTLKDKYGQQVIDCLHGNSKNGVHLSQPYNLKSSSMIVDEDIGSSQYSDASYTDVSNKKNADCSVYIQNKLGSLDQKRNVISKENKDFLEKAFQTKRTLNRKERAAIAEKCGLTPLQVRVWFTNKRMRSKAAIERGQSEATND